MGAFDDGPVDDGPVTNGHEPESEPDPEADRSRGPQPGGDPAEASGDGFEYVREGDLSGTRGKPYLTELPGDYVGDLLVMEWLEFLVSESDVTDAVRAINQLLRAHQVGRSRGRRAAPRLPLRVRHDRPQPRRPTRDRPAGP